jgi:hypothetical protein
MIVDMVTCLSSARLNSSVLGFPVASPSHEYLHLFAFKTDLAGAPSTVQSNGGGVTSSSSLARLARVQMITSDPRIGHCFSMKEAERCKTIHYH